MVTNDGLSCHNRPPADHDVPANYRDVADDCVVVNVCTWTNGDAVSKAYIGPEGHPEADGRSPTAAQASGPHDVALAFRYGSDRRVRADDRATADHPRSENGSQTRRWCVD
ncbi:MAG: hypothetical protein ACJARS_001186 [bacterium]|jgi:hypothetical protein